MANIYPWIAQQTTDGSVNQHLEYATQFKALGITDYRTPITDPIFTAFANTRAIAIGAATLGLNVTWGQTYTAFGGTKLTPTNYPAYEASMLANVGSCAANGIAIYTIGNEIENSGRVDTGVWTQTDVIGSLKASADLCKAAYPTVKLTYSCSGGSTAINTWGSAGLGTSLDFFSANIYGSGETTPSGFRDDVARVVDLFGTSTVITEFNLTSTTSGSFSLSQVEQERALDYRIGILKSYGVQRAFFFSWRQSSSRLSMVKDDGKTMEYFWSMFSQRRDFTTTSYTNQMPTNVLRKPRNGINRGKSIYFNSSNSALTFTAPATFIPSNFTNFTVATRLKPLSAGGGNAGRILDWISGASVPILNMFMSSTLQVNFQVYHTTTNASTLSTALSSSNWNAVICTFLNTDNSPRIYVNNYETTNSSTSKVGSRQSSSGVGQTYYIGNRSDLVRNYDGYIDDVFIWPRVLDRIEMKNYQNGNIPPGYIIGYTMDEASGLVIDQSGNSANATTSNVLQNQAGYTLTV